jgi:hypothetical protein
MAREFLCEYSPNVVVCPYASKVWFLAILASENEKSMKAEIHIVDSTNRLTF